MLERTGVTDARGMVKQERSGSIGEKIERAGTKDEMGCEEGEVMGDGWDE